MPPETTTPGREYHVSPAGNDAGPGTSAGPFKTISAAAMVAQPGDTVTVHAGTYRERIDPPRGGECDAQRITYQATAGERVEIKGSEIIKTWEHVEGDVWQVRLPNAFFGDFNPYRDLLQGHWLWNKERDHHCGAVYLRGHWLAEAARRDEVFAPARETPLWFCSVDETTTTIWAQFPGADPNKECVEINVRQTVFYPSQPGRNYITVRGFALSQAATPWCPPTTEQIGLIGVNWSKGWIIEKNTISYSACVGVTLGKFYAEVDFTGFAAVEGTEGEDTYHGTIERALANGWTFENIGSHVVRDNHISHCEAAGICGSFGAVNSLITGNTIHDIHVRELFGGAEQAGIKFHGAIDTEISRNHLFRCHRGIWLDWMSQGTRVTRNLCHDNGGAEDIFLEVNHGPCVVDNNLFLSKVAVNTWSHGGAYVHNFILGEWVGRSDTSRTTPYHKPHSTEVIGMHNIEYGDDRIMNNLLAHESGLGLYAEVPMPTFAEGNVFLADAKTCPQEKAPLVVPAYDATAVRLEEKSGEIFLHLPLDPSWASQRTRHFITTELLGKAKIPDLPYEDTDGSPLRIATDYFGKPRNAANPFPGPFEEPSTTGFKVWPPLA